MNAAIIPRVDIILIKGPWKFQLIVAVKTVKKSKIPVLLTAPSKDIFSSFKETFLIPWLIWTAKILCIGLSWDAKWIKQIESFPPETATKIRLLNERNGEISLLKFENVRGLIIANILYLNLETTSVTDFADDII